MSLYKLPDEVLLIIFNYCDAHDLFQLSGVCKRFYNIVSELLIKESNNLLITGQMSKKFRERCQPLLSSYREKFYIHNNWKRGRYQSKEFCSKWFVVSNNYYYEPYRNRLQLTKENVIVSINDYKLCALNRTKNGLGSVNNVIVANCRYGILDIFVPCNDIIVTLHKDGSIRQWTIESLDGRKYFNKKLLRSSYSNPYIKYHFMDVTPQSIITGASGEIEIWKYIPEKNSIKDKYIIPDLNLNRTLELCCMHFITFDPTGTKFAAGISHAIENDRRFIIYDINKCCTEMHIRTEDLDLDLYYADQILWKEPNDIFYFNQDKVIKSDARTHKVVQKWNVSFEWRSKGGELTCMSTDNQYAIMTGTSGGKVFLWDQRQSDFIQVYDKEEYVGNVNCLQFDSSRMYIAAEWGMYEFDFTKI